MVNNKEYEEFYSILTQINKNLIKGKIEEEFVRLCLEHKEKELVEVIEEENKEKEENNVNAAKKLNSGAKKRMSKTARRALRCNIGQKLKGESFRDFSNSLADSRLWQWFCLIDELAVIKPPSKSTLERYDKIVPDSIIEKVRDQLTRKAMESAPSEEEHPLGLVEPINIDRTFVDTSCLKANIHFPVDWVLLRDIVIRLIGIIVVIRKHKLFNRMSHPESFIKEINNLCIEMTHTRRKENAKQERKRILRKMKSIVNTVRDHGKRYRDLLDEDWRKTDLSKKEKDHLLRRLDKVLGLLPQAVKQAHERIIGGRQVLNKDKILSLHETEIHVIVRGKSGAEVEYGNTWVIAEQESGIIIYSKLIKDQAKADCHLLEPALETIAGTFGSYPGGVGCDRNFDSTDVRAYLLQKGIYNGVCPRDSKMLQERL